VPYQLNLWLGNSASGSSSGLHHDFHDNLYVLLRGSKRFTLFSPSDARKLYTNGSVELIHPNGLINYKGSLTRADGSTDDAVAALAQAEAEAELHEAEAELQRLEHSNADEDAIAVARERIEAAESKLEDAMDRVLQGGDDNSDGDGDGDDGFDFDNARDDYEDEDDEDNDDDEDDEAASAKVHGSASTGSGGAREDPNRFAHFSRIGTELLWPTDGNKKRVAEAHAAFPQLSSARRLVCHVKAGQMLYLPASWFHEVTSSSLETELQGPNAGHLALNYWSYPPDGERFEQPYADTYWSKRWRIKHGATPEPEREHEIDPTAAPVTSTSNGAKRRRARTAEDSGESAHSSKRARHAAK